MKVGIIALLHEGIKVTYFTNREIWNWCFRKYPEPDGGKSNNLTIILDRHRPILVKRDRTISDDEREVCTVTDRNTTGYEEIDIKFNDYLFLAPCRFCLSSVPS